MIECDCKDCERHTLHCKRDCPEWKVFQEKLQKIRKNRKADSKLNVYMFDQVRKNKEISRKKKHHRRKVR